MVSQKVTIKNPTGLHLRPAGLFCAKAMYYSCRITFQVNHTESNAKSILSILGAGVKKGDEIEIMCDGRDEEEALAELVNLVESGLGE